MTDRAEYQDFLFGAGKSLQINTCVVLFYFCPRGMPASHPIPFREPSFPCSATEVVAVLQLEDLELSAASAREGKLLQCVRDAAVHRVSWNCRFVTV